MGRFRTDNELPSDDGSLGRADCEADEPQKRVSAVINWPARRNRAVDRA